MCVRVSEAPEYIVKLKTLNEIRTNQITTFYKQCTKPKTLRHLNFSMKQRLNSDFHPPTAQNWWVAVFIYTQQQQSVNEQTFIAISGSYMCICLSYVTHSFACFLALRALFILHEKWFFPFLFSIIVRDTHTRAYFFLQNKENNDNNKRDEDNFIVIAFEQIPVSRYIVTSHEKNTLPKNFGKTLDVVVLYKAQYHDRLNNIP